MDIKIQPPKQNASIAELALWCKKLSEELNIMFDVLETRISDVKSGQKEEG